VKALQPLLRRLNRTTFWAGLALVALVGWTIDAVVMFLRMHESFQAGLSDFLAHFWYVVPVALAVIILSRLRPKAELLGFAVYDEAGRLVRQEGACGLSESVLQQSLTAMRTGQSQNLHGLCLPSGAQSYFVRQGAYTLVLTYSAAAESDALESGVQRLRADLPPTTFDVFAGLEPQTAATALNVLWSPVKREVLSYLYRYSHSAAQVVDLAYRLGSDEESITAALADLEQLGIVERMEACELVFFRLNPDEEVRRVLRNLFDWQATWHLQLTRLSEMVGEPRPKVRESATNGPIGDAR
jgi:DNA-binding transcriptional ArsR family regulator